MSVKDLKDLAKQHRIDISECIEKKEIVEKIQQKLHEPGETCDK